MAVRQRRVLVLVDGEVGSEMAGPEMRGWELARALAAWHCVTVAARDSDRRTVDGIDVIPYRRRTLVAAALDHEVLLATWFPPYLLAVLAPRRAIRVADLYDPAELELAAGRGAPAHPSELGALRALTRLQLSHADLVICATYGQRDALRGNVAIGSAVDPIVVPFGIAPPPPPASRGALRDRLEAIREADGVVLWWGSIWPWLDAATAIDGFVAANRDSWHLVFVAGLGRLLPTAAREGLDRARARARDLGALGRTVHFVQEWIPYDVRHEVLAEADVGLTMARDAPEARLAARARYMDYLWAGLPCVLSRGDETAATFAAAGCAELVDPEDAGGLAAALGRVMDDRPARLAARAAAKRLGANLRWPAVAEPLAAELARLPARRGRPAKIARDAAVFYALRTWGAIVHALRSRP